MARVPRPGAAALLALVVLVVGAACSGPGPSASSVASDSESASAAPFSVEPSSSPTASPDASVINGVFEVGGHGLYLKCRGTGSPTILYMHGSISSRSIVAHRNGEFAISALADDYRVCVYDRRNVGNSETVDAPQLPQDAIRDLRGLLGAAGVEPPYVLLGASFGGLLSYLYANEHPDEVVGMVLLDSMFPDELSLDDLFERKDTFEAFSAEDEGESLERISHFKVLKAAEPYIGHEPAIPVTYLSSIPEGYDVNDFGVAEYNERILDVQRAYVERFSPGRYVRVDSPHFMEAAIPGQIVDELRMVIKEAGY